MTRCPACDALNPESAAWCNQCYARLDEPGSLPSPAPASAQPSASSSAGQSEAFRRVDGHFEWACARCQTYNSIEADACHACGSPMMARFVDEEQASPEKHARAQRVTLLLPGAGHYVLGHQGSGVARAVLFVVWALGGLALLVTGNRAALAAAPLLLGAVALYAASVFDVRNLEAGRAELLAGRALLWLVVGVTALLLLGAFFGARAAG